MPIREYECKDCRLKFETIELGNTAENITCPQCHSENVQRQISSFSRPKGGGESCSTLYKSPT